MKALVTGAAGFIGTHLVKALKANGCEVADEIDPKFSVNATYESPAKYNGTIQEYLGANFHRGLGDITHVFHLGGLAGVQPSWDTARWCDYVQQNIVATHALLNACLKCVHPPKVIYASSSSVVGEGDGPMSPYGVSKKAGEDLMRVYARRGLHTVSLRYFTVYGPGQRPDMAFRKWIDATLHEKPIDVYGDGQQRRHFTYVDDIVRATVQAASAELPAGSVLDVADPEAYTLTEAISLIGLACHKTPSVRFLPATPGDPTYSARRRDYDCYGACTMRLLDGLERQVDWQKGL